MTSETKLQGVTKDCLYSQVRNTCSLFGVYQNSQSLLSGGYTSHGLPSAIHTKKEEGKLSQQKILRDWIMFRIIVAPNPSETFFYKKIFLYILQSEIFRNLRFFAIIAIIFGYVFVFIEKPTKFSFKDLSLFIWLRTLYCLDGDNDATKSSRI